MHCTTYIGTRHICRHLFVSSKQQRWQCKVKSSIDGIKLPDLLLYCLKFMLNIYNNKINAVQMTTLLICFLVYNFEITLLIESAFLLVPMKITYLKLKIKSFRSRHFEYFILISRCIDYKLLFVEQTHNFNVVFHQYVCIS